MPAENVPTSNINDLYTNTSSGTIASPTIMDAAVQDMVATINQHASYVNSLVTSGTLSPVPPESMRREAIINGNMNISKRNTVFTNPVGGSYTLDRYKVFGNEDGGILPTITHSQHQLAAGELEGSAYCYRLNFNGTGSALGANAYYNFQQIIENGTRYLCGAGKKVTVSFKARSDIANKRIGIRLIQGYGTGGSPSAPEAMQGTVFMLTSDFVECKFEFTTNTLSGKTFGSNMDDGLTLEIWEMWGSDQFGSVGSTTPEGFGGAGNVDIAQLRVGSTDLPFEPRGPAEEETICLRFNRRIGSPSAGGASPVIGSGFALSATSARIFVPFGMRMRTVPTLTTSGNFGIYNAAGVVVTTSITQESTTVDGVILIVNVATGLTTGQGVILVVNSDATAFLNFDAEI